MAMRFVCQLESPLDVLVNRVVCPSVAIDHVGAQQELISKVKYSVMHLAGVALAEELTEVLLQPVREPLTQGLGFASRLSDRVKNVAKQRGKLSEAPRQIAMVSTTRGTTPKKPRHSKRTAPRCSSF